MVANLGHQGPRAVGGGRSARYESRHASSGRPTSYAPVWTDAAAFAVLEQLKADMAAWNTDKLRAYTLKVLTSNADVARLHARQHGGVGGPVYSRQIRVVAQPGLC